MKRAGFGPSERETTGVFSRSAGTFEHEETTGLLECASWHKVVAVTGALGSGKSEWILNLAMAFRARGERVTVCDVDIINPYFCVRETAEFLESRGIAVVTAPGEARYGDLPALSPDIGRAIAGEGRVLLDIGGDAGGARALAQFAPQMEREGYSLLMVTNPFRPQTATAERIARLARQIEEVSGLEVSALVGNPHLMDSTTPEDVRRGTEIVRDASRETGLPLLYVCAADALAEEAHFGDAEEPPVWPLRRYILLPWERGVLYGKRAHRGL